MKNILLAIILLFCCLTGGLAQDTTCDPGDIAWVSEAVDANIGTNNAGVACTASVAGAEYNNIAAPFGIQSVFDCACAGLDIRILIGTGTPPYGSGTASWNNRDAANKTINIDTINASAALPIQVSGYTDATTEGLVTLDFERATIAGSDGFFVNGRSFYVFKNIQLQNIDAIGWALNVTTTNSQFYQCVGTLTSNDAWRSDSSGGNLFVQIQGSNSGNRGIALSGNSRVTQSEFFTNTSAITPTFGAVDLNNAGNIIEQTLVYGNSLIGIGIRGSGSTIYRSTVASNGSHGVEITGTPTGAIIQQVNLNANGGDGLRAITANQNIAMLAYNNYFDNTGTNKNVTVPVDIDLDTPTDITDPGYTPPDYQPPAGTVDFSITFPVGTTVSPETKGAANAAAGAAGSNDVAY